MINFTIQWFTIACIVGGTIGMFVFLPETSKKNIDGKLFRLKMRLFVFRIACYVPFSLMLLNVYLEGRRHVYFLHYLYSTEMGRVIYYFFGFSAIVLFPFGMFVESKKPCDHNFPLRTKVRKWLCLE